MRFIFFLFFFVFNLYFISSAQAVQPEVVQFGSHFFKPLEWAQIDATLPGKTSSWAKSFLLGPLGQTITGAAQIPSSSFCSSQKIQQRMQMHSTFPLWKERFSEVLKNCESEFSLGVSSSMRSSLNTVNLRLDLEEHPFLTPIELDLGGVQKLHAWFGWHGDLKPRPLLIIRGGIFSSSSEFLAERFLWMQFFEQGPFNVLLIENSSGPDFIYNNKEISVGGYFEAQQNLWIAKKIKSPEEPLSKIISSVHLMGISLGGQGVLLAHQWNDLNNSPFDSFLAYCPVVSLKKTSEALMSQGNFSVAADFWIAKRLQWLGQREESLAGYPWSSLFELNPHYQKKLWHFTEANFHGDLLKSLQVKIPKSYILNNNYWTANEYNFGAEPSMKELLILATQKDHLVPYDLNSRKFLNYKENIQVVQLSEGTHCSFPSNYDWNSFTSIIHSYWNRNLNLRNHWKVNSMEIELPENLKIQAKDISTIQWAPAFSEGDNEKKYIKIKSFIVLKNGNHISLNDLNWALSEIDFKFKGQRWNSAEKDLVARWLNQNLTLEVSEQSAKIAFNLSWKYWE